MLLPGDAVPLWRPCRKLGSTCKCRDHPLGAPSPTRPATVGPELGSGCHPSPPSTPLPGLSGLGLQAFGFEYNSLRRTRASSTNGIKDSGPSPAGSAGTGPPLPGSWDSFTSLPVLSRSPKLSGESRGGSSCLSDRRAGRARPGAWERGAGVRHARPRPRVRASIHAPRPGWTRGMGEGILASARGHCFAVYLLFSFTFFKKISTFPDPFGSMYLFFFPSTHPLCPFSALRTPKVDAFVSS